MKMDEMPTCNLDLSQRVVSQARSLDLPTFLPHSHRLSGVQQVPDERTAELRVVLLVHHDVHIQNLGRFKARWFFWGFQGRLRGCSKFAFWTISNWI